MYKRGKIIRFLLLVSSLTLVLAGCGEEVVQEKTLSLGGQDLAYEALELAVFRADDQGHDLVPLDLDGVEEDRVLEALKKLEKSDEEGGLDSAFEEGSLILKFKGEDQVEVYLIEEEVYGGDGLYWYTVRSSREDLAGVYKSGPQDDIKSEIEGILGDKLFIDKKTRRTGFF